MRSGLGLYSQFRTEMTFTPQFQVDGRCEWEKCEQYQKRGRRPETTAENGFKMKTLEHISIL